MERVRQMIDVNDECLVAAVIKLGGSLAARPDRTSKHTVVAGVRSESGRMYFGVNCDGIHGTCAEIVAYANAVLALDAKVDTIVAALISGASEGRIIPPCGNCRQIITELAPTSSVIISVDGTLRKVPISEMLPYPYRHAAN